MWRNALYLYFQLSLLYNAFMPSSWRDAYLLEGGLFGNICDKFVSKNVKISFLTFKKNSGFV